MIKKIFLISASLLFFGCAELKIPEKIKPVDTHVSNDLNTTNNLKKSIQFFKQLEIEEQIARTKSKKENIKELNDFFNKNFNYQKDNITYEMDDYWASFYEMIQSGYVGDCEDFTFGKIQLSELFGIEKKDIFIGFTLKGRHIFPIFSDSENFFIADTNGSLRKLDDYLKKYPDLKIYSYADIWKTNDIVFSKRRGGNVLYKMTGVSSEAKSR
jgi:hypothetical protein